MSVSHSHHSPLLPLSARTVQLHLDMPPMLPARWQGYSSMIGGGRMRVQIEREPVSLVIES